VFYCFLPCDEGSLCLDQVHVRTPPSDTDVWSNEIYPYHAHPKGLRYTDLQPHAARLRQQQKSPRKTLGVAARARVASCRPQRCAGRTTLVNSVGARERHAMATHSTSLHPRRIVNCAHAPTVPGHESHVASTYTGERPKFLRQHLHHKQKSSSLYLV
jgi:hypothetical protein